MSPTGIAKRHSPRTSFLLPSSVPNKLAKVRSSENDGWRGGIFGRQCDDEVMPHEPTRKRFRRRDLDALHDDETAPATHLHRRSRINVVGHFLTSASW